MHFQVQFPLENPFCLFSWNFCEKTQFFPVGPVLLPKGIYGSTTSHPKWTLLKTVKLCRTGKRYPRGHPLRWIQKMRCLKMPTGSSTGKADNPRLRLRPLAIRCIYLRGAAFPPDLNWQFLTWNSIQEQADWAYIAAEPPFPHQRYYRKNQAQDRSHPECSACQDCTYCNKGTRLNKYSETVNPERERQQQKSRQ